jgi:hypothetical protein
MAPTDDPLVEAFLTHLATDCGASFYTRRNYEQALREFAAWHEAQRASRPDWRALRRDDFRAYLRFLGRGGATAGRATGLSRASVQLRFSALRTLYRFVRVANWRKHPSAIFSLLRAAVAEVPTKEQMVPLGRPLCRSRRPSGGRSISAEQELPPGGCGDPRFPAVWGCGSASFAVCGSRTSTGRAGGGAFAEGRQEGWRLPAHPP